MNNIIFEDAKIFLKNLGGNPDRFNPRGGVRSFCVWVPEEMVDELISEGWAIKYTKPRDEEEEPKPYMKVKAAYGKVPPSIYICTKKNKTLLTADTVGSVDYAEIKRVDLVVRPYEYDSPSIGKGVAAYVKNMYVTIVEDPFADRYSYDEPEDEAEPF